MLQWNRELRRQWNRELWRLWDGFENRQYCPLVDDYFLGRKRYVKRYLVHKSNELDAGRN